MDKFKNKYRITSTRLQNWDYGSNGAYFITICTHNRQHYFGEIVEKEMQLSEIGKFAEQFWIEIPNHFSFIELGNFVVMPNHVHGILIINKMDDLMSDGFSIIETPKLGVSTTNHPTTNHPTTNHSTTNQNENEKTINQNQKYHTTNATKKWKPNTISSIINQYKRICTINARKILPDFAWQSRFHDHIIRNEESFERIQSYIENNPLKWNEDKFY